MKREEAFKLTPEISYVRYAEAKYRVAYVAEEFGVTWIGIYDEPPLRHVDKVLASNCDALPPADATAEEIAKNIWNRTFSGDFDNDIPDDMKTSAFFCLPQVVRAMHEFAAQRQPQPTAESVEEIPRNINKILRDFYGGVNYSIADAERDILKQLSLAPLTADKIVEGKLREELIKYDIEEYPKNMKTLKKEVLDILNDEFFGHPSRKEQDEIQRLRDIVLLLAEQIDILKTRSHE